LDDLQRAAERKGGAPKSKSSVRMASLPDGHAEQQFTCQQRIAVRASILLSMGFSP
jgi:hypothetical protein